MSKYIRTKDRILKYPQEEYLKQFVKDDEVACFRPGVGYLEWQKIIKQADTIEELCDMFVVWQEGVMPVEMPLSEKEQYEKMKKIVLLGTKRKMNLWLKLAIWTDKGLIYTAKMNDKGELELI